MNGVNGTEFNYVNSEDPSKGKVYVRPDAVDCSVYDPNHGFEVTTEKIFDCNF